MKYQNKSASTAGHFRGHPAAYWAAQADSLAARLAAAEQRAEDLAAARRHGDAGHSAREEDVVWFSAGDRVRYAGCDPDSMLVAGDIAVVVCPNRDVGDGVAIIKDGADKAVVVAPGSLDWLDPEQDVVPPAGAPAWVDRAVAAIRTWEPDLNVADMAPGEVIERLLSTWRWAERLTSAQVDEVIGRVLDGAS